MAFECEYIVSIDLIHPHKDVQQLSSALPDLEPTRAINAGTLKEGRPRPTKFSVWSSRLHEPEKLDSETISVSDFLAGKLDLIAKYSHVYREVALDGTASLEIVLFSKSQHSAEVINADVLRRIGESGLALDLEFYGPDHGYRFS